MQPDHVGKCFLDDPVDDSARKTGAQIGGDRQVVDHVAEGGCLDQENAHR
jgi:hypothetical protein